MPKVTASLAAGATLFITTLCAQSTPPVPVRIILTELPGIGHADVIAEFRLSETGGSINLTPAHTGDPATIQTLRAYVSVLQRELAAGGISALAALAPAAKQALARMRANRAVSIGVQQAPGSTLLNFAASDQGSRTVIHDYIRIARGRPKLTEAERALNRPGNNLGWDASKSGELEK